jgi:pyrroloquinoline quinone (PQQ) biosynthesis protein C
MRAIGIPEAFVESPAPAVVNGRYRSWMIDECERHPYGGLGAKGVLEHLALKISDELAQGVRHSCIPGISSESNLDVYSDKGVVFLRTHGVLDKVHVKHGNENILSKINNSNFLEQIIDGAYVTREAYHSFLHAMHESYENALKQV